MNEWERAQRRQHQLRELAARRQVSARRLREQTLASGWTWNQVLAAHNFHWSAALAYWDECRRLENQDPAPQWHVPGPDHGEDVNPGNRFAPPPAAPRPPGGRLRGGYTRRPAKPPEPPAPRTRQAWESWDVSISRSEPGVPDDDNTDGPSR